MSYEKRKINVLLVVDKLVFHGATINGPSRYYSWMLENIDRDRYNVTLVSLRGDTGADHLFRKHGYSVLYLDSHKYNVFAFLKILSLLRRLDIDVMHLSGYASCTLGRIAATFTDIPVIVHEHWADPDLPFYITWVEALLAYKTSHAIAISDLARDTLTNGKKISANKVSVIRNGIPLDRFGSVTVEQAQAFRAELGVSDDVRLIGMVAMLEQNKGHRHVIQAMQEVIKKHPEAQLLIVGEGETRPQLEKQIAELGLERNVRLLGIRDDVNVIDKALDVFVVGSMRETASLVALESMASGCAIITTDCGGPTEFIRDGENGLVVPVKDSVAMTQAITRLLDDPSLREQLAAKAKNDSKQFDVRHVTRQIEQLYSALSGHVRLAL